MIPDATATGIGIPNAEGPKDRTQNAVSAKIEYSSAPYRSTDSTRVALALRDMDGKMAPKPVSCPSASQFKTSLGFIFYPSSKP